MAEESKDKVEEKKEPDTSTPEKKPVTGLLNRKWNKWVKISFLGMAGLLITIWAVAVLTKP